MVLLPDGGRGYLSKIFNDEWMADYGFLTAETTEPRVADVLGRKAAGAARVRARAPRRDGPHAIEILREYDVSQLPVVKDEPPVMAAEVVGSIVERDLLDALVSGRARPPDAIEAHMSPPLPMIGSGEPVSRGGGRAGEVRRRGRARRRQARPA